MGYGLIYLDLEKRFDMYLVWRYSFVEGGLVFFYIVLYVGEGG